MRRSDVRQAYRENHPGSHTDVVHGLTSDRPRRRHSYQGQVVSDCTQKPSRHGVDANLAGELHVDPGPGRCDAYGMEISVRSSGRQGTCILQVDAVLARLCTKCRQVSDDWVDAFCPGHAR